MRVVAVLGSPRSRASSIYLAQCFLDVASELGAKTNSFILNDLKFIGCQGCYGCKRRSEVCVIRDELTAVLEAVADCDVLLLATPVYIHDVTGQMKLFIDRAFSYLTPEFYTGGGSPTRLAPGKKMLFIQTQGAPDAATFARVAASYETFFKGLGFAVQSIIVPGVGLQEKLEQSRPELIKQIEDMARKLCAK